MVSIEHKIKSLYSILYSKVYETTEQMHNTLYEANKLFQERGYIIFKFWVKESKSFFKNTEAPTVCITYLLFPIVFHTVVGLY